MAHPLLLVENFFSVTQFPAHVITGDEEAAGFEAFHVGTERRDAVTNHWAPITANAPHQLQVVCDRLRAANYLFIDRGHNLGGLASVQLQVSQDGASWETVATFTIPPLSAPGILSNVNGVTTEELAWGITFPVNAGVWWRLNIPAMGAGLLPQVVGLYLGMAWDPGFFDNPWGEDQTDLVTIEAVSDRGWRGRGPTVPPKAGDIGLKLPTEDVYDVARYHIGGHWSAGRPMWICYDQEEAERTFLALRPVSHLNIGFLPVWFPRQVRFPYVEHEPLVA
jgi:hypothetical protein